MLPRRGARWTLALGIGIALLASAMMSPRVEASPPAQSVVVENTGSETVRVRLFSSEENACSSGHQLYFGAVAAGEAVSFEASANCVCAEQTYADRSDAPWSLAERFCRPQICAGYGRAQSCEPAPDSVIRIHIDDKPVP